MIKSFFLNPVRKWLQIHQDLANCYRFGRRQMNLAYNQIVKSIDTQTLDRLFKESHTLLEKAPAAAPKYYNYKEWLSTNIIRAAQCKLHMKQNMNILDLGCGPGWFLAVSDYFGHTASGIEMPLDDLPHQDRTVYQNIPNILLCSDNIVRHKIQAFVPVEIKGAFDLITGFQVCFNNHRKPDVWGTEQWHFFIRDLTTHLKKNGKIYLEMNLDTMNFPKMRYYDQQILDLFLNFGSVDRYKVILKA